MVAALSHGMLNQGKLKAVSLLEARRVPYGQFDEWISDDVPQINLHVSISTRNL